jgi:hypothetical protein
MKNKITKIVAVLEIIMGVIFLMSIGSDIQFGFGVVLLAQGIIHLAK